MNYGRPELLERLAAEYAVGVLRAGARVRFERLCEQLPQALRARQRWEDRLLPLALQAPPVNPGSACWPRIQAAVDATRAGSVSGGAARIPAARRSRTWLAVAAGLIAVALLVGRMTVWSPPSWQAVAVLAPAHAAPLWRLERDRSASRISIRAVGTPVLAATQNYELWVLPRGAGNPVSLGLLPREGRLERALTPAQRQFLLAGAKVAVSIEPAGGSPTGLPTGPVVIVADISGNG